MDQTHPAHTTPQQWASTFSAAPVASSEGTPLKVALLRRWSGTDAVMIQPPLDHHYLVLHLGGAKRVSRSGDGPHILNDVANGAITFVPSGSAFRWTTDGPIDFAHLYLAPKWLDHVVAEDFDCEPLAVTIDAPVGESDRLLRALYEAMLDEVADPRHPDALYLETLNRALAVRFLHLHAGLLGARLPRVHSISPRKLRATLEFIDTHIGAALDLASVAEVCALSPFHFSRMFKRQLGVSPYAYVLNQRIAKAKTLLSNDALSIADVAARCGFKSVRQFAATFKSRVGATPEAFRRAR